MLKSREALVYNQQTLNPRMFARRLKYSCMDDLDDIRYRMHVTKLESRLALLEIETAALAREISSPLTSSTRRAVAADTRETLQAEWSEIMEELQKLRKSRHV